MHYPQIKIRQKVHGDTNTLPKCSICKKALHSIVFNDKEKSEIREGNEDIAVED